MRQQHSPFWGGGPVAAPILFPGDMVPAVAAWVLTAPKSPFQWVFAGLREAAKPRAQVCESRQSGRTEETRESDPLAQRPAGVQQVYGSRPMTADRQGNTPVLTSPLQRPLSHPNSVPSSMACVMMDDAQTCTSHTHSTVMRLHMEIHSTWSNACTHVHLPWCQNGPWLANWPELIMATLARGATRRNAHVFAGNELGWIRLA